MKARKGTRLATILLAIVMLLVVAACGENGGDVVTDSPGSETQSGETNTTVAVGTTNPYYAFNPNGATQPAIFCRMMVYDTLFAMDVTTEYYSPISDDWGWDDDTTLRITLKDGITFSNGSQMTGVDVMASFQFAQDCGSQMSTFWDGVIDFEKSYLSEDEMTVYLIYTKPYGPALSELASLAIMDDEFIAEHPGDDEIWWTDPMGSGPYEVKDTMTDSYVTYSLREDYWDTSRTFDCTEITVRHYTDSTAMLVDYQNGVIDAAFGLDSIQVDSFESGEIEGNLVKNSLYSVPAMVMNENNEYLQDIEVRKAIAHAVNWSAVGEIAWGSLQTSADSHWPASTSYYVSHEGYTYDPDLAVQILKDAGYDPSEMSFYYIAVSSNAQEMRVMEAVQGYLGDIGITVECASYELNTALPYYFAGENDLAILNSTNGLNDVWSIYSATYNGLFVDRGLSDPEYRALLEEGLNTVDPEARAEAYRKLDDWLYENYWFLPYCEIQEAWCHNDRIAEMKMASSNFGCLGDIKLA